MPNAALVVPFEYEMVLLTSLYDQMPDEVFDVPAELLTRLLFPPDKNMPLSELELLNESRMELNWDVERNIPRPDVEVAVAFWIVFESDASSSSTE